MDLPSSYLVLDLETSVKNRGPDAIGNNKAAPWHPDNNVVIGGYRRNTDPDGEVLINAGHFIPFQIKYSNTQYLLVGHNIKFDLHYLMHKGGYDFRHMQIWDTQLAEYLLTGQNKKYPKLDDVAVKYGGTLKDDRVKAFWDAGVDTEDIPLDILEEYLKNDVLNTELVFKAQWKKANELGMLPLILSQMEALMCTIEMEYNGLYFDKEYAATEIEVLEEEKDTLEAALTNIFTMVLGDDINVNVYSPDQLSLVFFGGKIKHRIDEVITDATGNPVLYKTGPKAGQAKTRKADAWRDVAGLGVEPQADWKAKKAGMYFTNDDVLSVLKNHSTPAVAALAKTVLKLRGIKKDHTTYFVGYSNLVWPDGCIHHGLNHTSTGTGRLSSTHPNTQNLTSGD